MHKQRFKIGSSVISWKRGRLFLMILTVWKIVFHSILEIFHFIPFWHLPYSITKFPFDSIPFSIPFYFIPCLANWNERRSRREFLCFYSAIFELTSAKFQSFSYNSRTVWSRRLPTWNFNSSLRLISNMFVPNFKAIVLRDFGFGTRKPPRRFNYFLPA